ncbi:type II toxin-antitoxin system RelB/DinJ family antitoxin [Rhodoferax antarcticus]|uniref:RelB antitoxin family protein n=1 Tax=Rhodoferax antarcticus ANT.BR TaxID=1111071 RepID=A0A1Q8YK07_9BURK|nr:relB antitoxin family protein [Rhodoferax antarcticus ANT.BR]
MTNNTPEFERVPGVRLENWANGPSDVDATIQLRMNSTIKDGAFAVLREMGISPSEAVRVFMTQVYKTRTLPLVIAADGPEDSGQPAEASYTEWLRTRLQKNINALDSGEMKSYSNETAKAVLHARLEARRSKMNLPAKVRPKSDMAAS